MRGKILGWKTVGKGGSVHFYCHAFARARDAEFACKLIESNGDGGIYAKVFSNLEQFQSWRTHMIFDFVEQALVHARGVVMSPKDRKELAKLARKILR